VRLRVRVRVRARSSLQPSISEQLHLHVAGSINCQVTFEKGSYKDRALLQKKPSQ